MLTWNFRFGIPHLEYRKVLFSYPVKHGVLY